MSRIQLYLDDGMRRVIINKHKFYMEQVRKRLMSQFEDLEGQADAYGHELEGVLSQAPAYGHHDNADLAGWVWDETVAHYQQLADLRKQVFLSSLGGMFHLWDKEVREFLELELRHYTSQKWIEQHVWPAKTIDIFKLLEEFGWRAMNQPFYPLIDACNVIVNVYKHGKGASLKRLHSTYPRYLSRMPYETFGQKYIDHRWVEISQEDFEEFAKAFEDFWKEFPERSFYQTAD